MWLELSIIFGCYMIALTLNNIADAINGLADKKK